MVSATAPPAKKSIPDYAPAPKEFDQAQVAFYARIRALATRVSDKRVKEARKSAARAAQRHRDVELRVAKKFRADALKAAGVSVEPSDVPKPSPSPKKKREADPAPKVFALVEGTYLVQRLRGTEFTVTSEGDYTGQVVVDVGRLIAPGVKEASVVMALRRFKGKGDVLVIHRRLPAPKPEPKPIPIPIPMPEKVVVRDRTPAPLRNLRRRHHDGASHSDDA